MKRLVISVVVAMFTFTLLGVSGYAQAKPSNPLVGNWLCQEDGTRVQIRANGTLSINDAEYAYKVKGSTINVMNEEGAAAMPFQLDGDTLTVEYQGREIVYVRVKAGSRSSGAGTGSGTLAGSAAIMQALVGKWCYMSNLTGTSSRMSNRCFILNGDGTYEYSAETSSSNPYGGTSSQEYDAGRWTATATSITAMSNKHGKIVYPMELRNHPKTGDPMIVVDGDAYVTAFQRRPW